MESNNGPRPEPKKHATGEQLQLPFNVKPTKKTRPKQLAGSGDDQNG